MYVYIYIYREREIHTHNTYITYTCVWSEGDLRELLHRQHVLPGAAEHLVPRRIATIIIIIIITIIVIVMVEITQQHTNNNNDNHHHHHHHHHTANNNLFVLLCFPSRATHNARSLQYRILKVGIEKTEQNSLTGSAFFRSATWANIVQLVSYRARPQASACSWWPTWPCPRRSLGPDRGRRRRGEFEPILVVFRD